MLGAGTAGQRALAAAQAEVGVAEQPPGSNDGPRIAEYRAATAGSGVGPWCAYFTSWAAAQAGAPLGEVGQGFGSVDALYAWAQRTGRAVPAGPGVAPSPGDLIVWGGRHIGIVESVDPDGSIHTIEGNSSNAVSRRTYGPDGGGATGYVRLG
jgi:CHAP domain